MRGATFCLGVFPPLIARVIRWAIKRNPSSTVSCVFRGRKRKPGKQYHWGTLRLVDAKRFAVYVVWNPARPVNRRHAKAYKRQEARAQQYRQESCDHRWTFDGRPDATSARCIVCGLTAKVRHMVAVPIDSDPHTVSDQALDALERLVSRNSTPQ